MGRGRGGEADRNSPREALCLDRRGPADHPDTPAARQRTGWEGTRKHHLCCAFTSQCAQSVLQGTQGRPPSPFRGSARFCLDPHLHGNSGRSERTSAQIKAAARAVGVPVRLSPPARAETIEPGLGCKRLRRSRKNHRPYQIPTVAHRLCSIPCHEPESARPLASGKSPGNRRSAESLMFAGTVTA